MESIDRGPTPPDPDGVPGGNPGEDPAIAQLLVHWDELPPQGLGNLSRHPLHGPRLERLRGAEAWLEELGRGPCPEPGELYDFARGPGFRALAFRRRQGISEHLSRCGECAALVETLASTPPLPLDLGGDLLWEGALTPRPPSPRPTPGPRAPTTHTPGPRRSWVPLAAAASVLLFTLAQVGPLSGLGGPGDGGLPTYPLVRGEVPEGLLFPRGRVLPVGAYPGEGFALHPRFEIAPVPGARAYRARLHRHDGGAFARGETVLRLEGEEPVLEPELPPGQGLQPGFYTWEAWAIVDGLHRSLGERDFQVLADPTPRLPALGDLDPAARVRHLHEAGYLTDARHLARRLPASPGRDAYLGASPGR